jgi:hypothetical protein
MPFQVKGRDQDRTGRLEIASFTAPRFAVYRPKPRYLSQARVRENESRRDLTKVAQYEVLG